MIERFKTELATELAVMRYQVNATDDPHETTLLIREAAEFHVGRAVLLGAFLGFGVSAILGTVVYLLSLNAC